MAAIKDVSSAVWNEIKLSLLNWQITVLAKCIYLAAKFRVKFVPKNLRENEGTIRNRFVMSSRGFLAIE